MQVPPEQQEVRDRCVIQIVGQTGDIEQSRQVVRDEKRALVTGREQRPSRELVARTKQPPALPIPDREAEVAEQMFDDTLAPTRISAKDQLGIASRERRVV
jgi:hypothetical protein